MIPASEKLPTRIVVANGFGSIAYGVKDNGFSTFLLIFYSQVVGLDAKLVSLALMFALMADAFVDPLIGHLSDRTYTRWGRRHPWLYIAPWPLAVAWMMLWSPPEDHTHIFLYLVVVAILVRTLVSACEVPSQSLVAELTTDYEERTRLTRFRYLFGWAGGLLAFFLANAVFLRSDATHKFGQLNPDGYWKYGLAGAIIMLSAVLISAIGLHRRVAHLPATRPEPSSPLHALKEIGQSLRHPAAVILLSAALIAISSTQMTFTIANFLYLYVWQFSEFFFALLPFLLMASVFLAFTVVQPLHRRIGKRATAVACGFVTTGFWITPYALRLGGIWPVEGTTFSSILLMSFMFVSNAAAVSGMVSAQSMLADVVEASQQETGRRTEGVFASGWMFVQKCGTAVGIGITGVLLDYAGLRSHAIPGQVDPLVIDKLTIAYAGIVVVAAAASTYTFSRFPISRADHEARLSALAAAATIDHDADGAHP
ncbi:MFS transporter [Tsuneonella mangrovi]|uniref:MFS transporter n=1 Tax=Tsuneonella mangrovi TaxID=1982042 RepID=UPI000BA2509B|nr:MFS transporter [Tsuneonella mangrovi]